MNYNVFTENLCISAYENRLKFIIDPSVLVDWGEDTPDNYAKHRDFGMWRTDESNARNHAIQIIRQLYYEKNDEIKKDKLQKQLCEDIKNYFECIMLKKKGGRNSFYAMEFAEIMAAFDLEKELISIVNEYFKSCMAIQDESDEKSYQSIFALDFINLYKKIGDRALFVKGDIILAIQCYALADLDWYDFRDDEGVMQNSNSNQNDLDRALYWHKEYEYYKRIISDEVSVTDIQNDNYLNKELKYIYCQILEKETLLIYRELWELATEFYDVLKGIKKTNPDIMPHMRSTIFLAYMLRDKAILAGLLCLEDEKSGVKGEIISNVYNCIINSKNNNLRPLREYSINKDATDSLLKILNQFAKTLFITCQIKEDLLVDETPKDMAYYTSLETFLYMLPVKTVKGEKCGRLSVMNIAYMNDPNEGKLLKKILFKNNDTLENGFPRKSVRYPYVFMKCFTSRIDDLPMWEMYGNHAEGCCLILDWEKSVTIKSNRRDVPLYRVCYAAKSGNRYIVQKKDNEYLSPDAIKRINSNLRQLRTIAFLLNENPEALESFMVLLEEILYLFKDSSYSYEEELRIYYNYPSLSEDFKHTDGEYPMLFIQPEFSMHLKEVIIGPKFRNIAERLPYIQEQIEQMCTEINAKIPRITISGIEYK